MDNNKVMIVGTGNVGASIAFAITQQRTAVNELVLTDILAHDAEGEAMDLKDALAVAPSYVKIKSGTYKDAKDCDVVVITAGAAQRPGAPSRSTSTPPSMPLVRKYRFVSRMMWQTRSGMNFLLASMVSTILLNRSTSMNRPSI